MKAEICKHPHRTEWHVIRYDDAGTIIDISYHDSEQAATAAALAYCSGWGRK